MLVVPIAWVGKLRLVCDGVTFGPDVTPVPLKATDCGLPTALSVILIAAARGPIAVGLKIMLIVHFAPAAMPVLQVLVWLKSVALAPVTTMLLIIKGKTPAVSVRVCAALLVPTN